MTKFLSNEIIFCLTDPATTLPPSVTESKYVPIIPQLTTAPPTTPATSPPGKLPIQRVQ